MAAITASDGQAQTRLRDFLDKRAAKVLHQPGAGE